MRTAASEAALTKKTTSNKNLNKEQNFEYKMGASNNAENRKRVHREPAQKKDQSLLVWRESGKPGRSPNY